MALGVQLPAPTATFTRTLTASSESIAASIDALQLPFQDELEQYVKVSDTEINALITTAKSLLTTLGALNSAFTGALVLNASDYDDNFSAGILSSYQSAVLDLINNANLALGYVIDPNFKTDTADYEDAYSMTAALLLDTSIFNTSYSMAYQTFLNTYITTAGTGLDATTEAAIYARARARILADANRNARRITSQLMSRMPYSGELVDALHEADQDVVTALSDVNNKILEEQGRLTYQSQLDRAIKALELDGRLMENYHTTKERYLKSLIAYDDEQLKKDQLGLESFEKGKDTKLRAYIAYDDNQMKQAGYGLEKCTLVYNSRRDGIQAANQIEKMLRDHYTAMKEIKFRSSAAIDDITVRNHWSYYETLIKINLGYIGGVIDLIKSNAYNPDQMTFNNWLEMARILGDGQLRIAALVNSLMPGNSL